MGALMRLLMSLFGKKAVKIGASAGTAVVLSSSGKVVASSPSTFKTLITALIGTAVGTEIVDWVSDLFDTTNGSVISDARQYIERKLQDWFSISDWGPNPNLESFKTDLIEMQKTLTDKGASDEEAERIIRTLSNAANMHYGGLVFQQILIKTAEEISQYARDLGLTFEVAARRYSRDTNDADVNLAKAAVDLYRIFRKY